MITDKLNESIEVKKQWIYDSLNEISKIAGDGLDVDDGPNIIYPSAPLFKKISSLCVTFLFVDKLLKASPIWLGFHYN